MALCARARLPARASSWRQSRPLIAYSAPPPLSLGRLDANDSHKKTVEQDGARAG